MRFMWTDSQWWAWAKIDVLRAHVSAMIEGRDYSLVHLDQMNVSTH